MLLSSKPGIVEVEPTRLFGLHKAQRTEPREPLGEGQEDDEGGGEGGVPVYFSNPDLLWKTQHPFPRFGQGAFRIALEAVYKARLEALGLLSGHDDQEGRGGSQSSLKEGCLASQANEGTPTRSFEFFVQKWKQYGKPEVAQFMHAQEAIEAQLRRPCDEAEEKGGGRLERAVSHYYMVGDNPASDMAGARNMMRAHALLGGASKEAHALSSDEPSSSLKAATTVAAPWSGILVCTGVYNGAPASEEANSDGERTAVSTEGAALVVEDVVAAVEAVLRENGAEH